tara:strand:- start:4788 stop:4982 length:195 start_codon:yes stop_codon:yes gene_type:complete
MTKFKITDARNEKHIGKIINVIDDKTIFNKKEYYLGELSWNNERPMTLISERITPPIWVKLSEV